MSQSSDQNFQSVVILGLKTALIEAESEINRLKSKLSVVKREALQCYLKCGKAELISIKQVSKLNEFKSKLQQELKAVRRELEERKKELADKENENINLQFKVKEIKSLLDIKVELLESLNIKGDKVNKNTLTEARSDHKTLIKNLKTVIRNRPCYSDQEVLDDIRKLVFKIDGGNSVQLSKYLIKKNKTEKKENASCDEDVTIDEKIQNEPCDFRGKSTHSDDEVAIEAEQSSSNFENANNLSIQSSINLNLGDVINVSEDSNVAHLSPHNSTNTKAKISCNGTKEELVNPLEFNVTGTTALVPNNASSLPVIDTMSDSEGDETSGFCDGETEVESPTSLEFCSSQQTVKNALLIENHASPQCMPNLPTTVAAAPAPNQQIDRVDCNNHKEAPPVMELRNNLETAESLVKPSSPVRQEISQPILNDNCTIDFQRLDKKACEILDEMQHMKKFTIEFTQLKQFYEKDQIKDHCVNCSDEEPIEMSSKIPPKETQSLFETKYTSKSSNVNPNVGFNKDAVKDESTDSTNDVSSLIRTENSLEECKPAHFAVESKKFNEFAIPAVPKVTKSSYEKPSEDAFSIVEEMSIFQKRLSAQYDELNEFLNLISTSSPKRAKYMDESISTNGNEIELLPKERERAAFCEENDDSTDETLFIAEDDRTNYGDVDGIEANGYISRDTNFTNASMVCDSGVEREGNATKLNDAIALEKDKNDENPVKFQFYKESEVKNVETTEIKYATPFDKVWDSIKSMIIEKPKLDENLKLIPCGHSIPHLALHYKCNRKDTRLTRKNNKTVDLKEIKDYVHKFVQEVVKNEFIAVQLFISSAAKADSLAIAHALMNATISYAKEETKTLICTLEKLVNLSYELEREHDDFVSQLKNVLQDKMFTRVWERNSNVNMVSGVISLSIFYTLLCKRRYDLKSVKDLLFQSLCFLKYRAHPIAFGVLIAFPRVFDKLSRSCFLTQVILFTLINHSMEYNPVLYKVHDVREMIGRYYNIRLGYKAAEDFAKESMYLFNDDTWVEAVELLCKRQEFSWSYRNVIVKYLLQIVNRWKEYDFCEVVLMKTVQALYKVVRCCPMRAIRGAKTNPNHQLYNIDLIVNSLSAVLYSEKGSRELRETVLLAIFNISHLSFELCSKILLNWKPADGVVTDQTLEKINSIVKEKFAYPNWCQLIKSHRFRGNSTTNKNNFKPRTSPRECDDVIRVGISRNSIVPMKPKKKQKKKKRKCSKV